MVTPAHLAALFTRAYIERLDAPVLPVVDLPRRVRLDTPDRAPIVPLRPPGGDDAR